ncbi:MAG: glycoside hydrolase family 2 [Oscillospiraceae bacterium]|nr:glycoside hydrolase family 2 [Oscillospiraceae bacterium]
MNELYTVWGEQLDREHPLPEYPRPQMRRDSYVNLNGIWHYAFTHESIRPLDWMGEIVVPFSPESLLSGVGRQLQSDEFLWYERSVTLPDGFNAGRVLLHFGAVDQCADIWWNGKHAARHEGGYLPFEVDITSFLRKGENTLTVRVTDSLIHTPHAYGKQRYKRGGIWYTATSGIWQTVWLESVPNAYLRSVELTPDFDAKILRWRVKSSEPLKVHAVVYDGETMIAQSCYENEGICRILPEYFHPWTPEDPFLYRIVFEAGKDRVESYFAMRKFGVTDYRGHTVFALNNKPYFHNGLLDQGYWSDGLYTAPSDEALVFDIQTAKRLGFNMLRKHIKIEPLRWYYHCDRLGMLVWQDMVSGGGRYDPIVVTAPLFTGMHISDAPHALFGRTDRRGREQFLSDTEQTVRHLFNCPCVALWTLFNEGWGQFDALTAADRLRALDPTRPVDHASGWHDQGGGDVKSWHVYFKPLKIKGDGRRVLALTEFGGYSLPIKGHAFAKQFGYRMYTSAADWQKDYVKLYEEQVLPLIDAEGLSATVYTELSDVEDELNGLLTFDRRVCKAEEKVFRPLNERLRFM